jgi:hypothetical protein
MAGRAVAPATASVSQPAARIGKAVLRVNVRRDGVSGQVHAGVLEPRVAASVAPAKGGCKGVMLCKRTRHAALKSARIAPKSASPQSVAFSAIDCSTLSGQFGGLSAVITVALQPTTA